MEVWYRTLRSDPPVTINSQADPKRPQLRNPLGLFSVCLTGQAAAAAEVTVERAQSNEHSRLRAGECRLSISTNNETEIRIHQVSSAQLRSGMNLAMRIVTRPTERDSCRFRWRPRESIYNALTDQLRIEVIATEPVLEKLSLDGSTSQAGSRLRTHQADPHSGSAPWRATEQAASGQLAALCRRTVSGTVTQLGRANGFILEASGGRHTVNRHF